MCLIAEHFGAFAIRNTIVFIFLLAHSRKGGWGRGHEFQCAGIELRKRCWADGVGKLFPLLKCFESIIVLPLVGTIRRQGISVFST